MPEFTVQSFKFGFRFLVANAACVEYYKKYLVIVGRVELTVFCKLLRGPCEVVELEVICESVLIRFLLPLQNER